MLALNVFNADDLNQNLQHGPASSTAQHMHGGASRMSMSRSTNACHRCKRKKLKCHFVGLIQEYNHDQECCDTSLTTRRKCAACSKANTECQFDRPRPVVNRSAEYVTALEAHVVTLKEEIVAMKAKLCEQDLRKQDPTIRTTLMRNASVLTNSELVARGFSSQHGPRATHSSFTTPYSGPSPSTIPPQTLPDLPSDDMSELLLETVYLYTQARYCLVDWVKVRQWHHERHSICYASVEDSSDLQIGAYFIWIIYAIGASFVPSAEHPPKAYFARAHQYLHAVLEAQDLTTVQALLTLCQYQGRAQGGPSVWQLSGIAMRLCIELGYHQRTSEPLYQQDPLQRELQNRSFWCAYCFDRIASTMMGKQRPFAIQDVDINQKLPLNVDVNCSDSSEIARLQLQDNQFEEGHSQHLSETQTTMTSALHHLRMYRLKSKITLRLCGLRSPPLTGEEVTRFITELDDWWSTAPRSLPSDYPRQDEQWKRGFYLQTMLQLMRPVLNQSVLSHELLRLCVEKAVEACEVAKLLILHYRTNPTLVELYQCFSSGVTLLECLTFQPTILPHREIMRAILACSSGLSAYSRYFPTATTFLELFEKLSDGFLGTDDSALDTTMLTSLRATLQDIMASNVYETPNTLASLSRINLWSSDQTRQTQSQKINDNDPAFRTAGVDTPTRGIDMSDDVVPSDLTFNDFLFDNALREWTDFTVGMEQ